MTQLKKAAYILLSSSLLFIELGCSSGEQDAPIEQVTPTPGDDFAAVPQDPATPSEEPAATPPPDETVPQVTAEDTAVTGSLTDPDPVTTDGGNTPPPQEAPSDTGMADITQDPPSVEESVPPPLDSLPEKAIKKKKSSKSSTRVVKAAKLNIRSKPNPKAKSVGVLNHGDQVEVLSIKGSWAKLGPGKWVKTKYLSKPSGAKKKKSKKQK